MLSSAGQTRAHLVRLTAIGTWLSLVERCVRDAEVAGSNPVVPTMKTKGLTNVVSPFFCLTGNRRRNAPAFFYRTSQLAFSTRILRILFFLGKRAEICQSMVSINGTCLVRSVSWNAGWKKDEQELNLRMLTRG